MKSKKSVGRSQKATVSGGKKNQPEELKPQEVGEETSGTDKMTVVGIGASAGGLAALREFFTKMPEETGLAFVVVVHLSPEHESHLVNLLQPHCRMPVRQVTETLPLEPDHVYVIPPGRNLNTIDTHLRPSALEDQRRQRAPIDHFFRTLSETHGPHAIGVILTGTGSDGTLGLRQIKEKAGLTIVQDPLEAEYDGMPRSALATGMVDVVLPVAEMPSRILRFARTEPQVQTAGEGESLADDDRQLLQKIFAQIRARTGRDFNGYKRSTVLRRIKRRMQLRYHEQLAKYLELLRKEPDEVQRLSDDLLITVTSFFRDAEVFECLEHDVIPQLFAQKGFGDRVRIWSIGCATGEEAYSLAILLLEELGRRDGQVQLQVFAADLHRDSLTKAREGLYPESIEADVSPERLQRFFTKENGSYRIRKEVRDIVVFAPHDLLRDPPFSHLDLIACRNMLIYLQPEVQKQIVEVFHYALEQDGFLLLGTSESIDRSDLFTIKSKKDCVYRRRNVTSPEPHLPVFPILPPQIFETTRYAVPPEHAGGGLRWGGLHEKMVERYAPPSVLLNPDYHIVHSSEHAGRYLRHPGGEPTTNIFKLVCPELTMELRSAIFAAKERGEAFRSKPVPVQLEGQTRYVVLRVRPAEQKKQELQGLLLVIFDEVEAPERSADVGPSNGDTMIGELESELQLTRERLQHIIEEHESSQEEMRATNEELLSANEELRSTLEELETSKEELQSVNEELATLNQENRHKVEELNLVTGDLQNLLSSMEIATVFLDRDLRIMRFTPSLGELFNVWHGDRGRPLSDLTHRLGYNELLEDAREVLVRLTPIEREVSSEQGRWYLTRLLPYRADDRVEGVVITFVDITRRKQAEDKLVESQNALEELNESLERRVKERTDLVHAILSRLTMAEQAERQRISEILHDNLQQLLYSIQMKLTFVLKHAETGDAEKLLGETHEAYTWVKEAIASTRRLTVDLSPPVLPHEGLNEALDWLVRQMKEAYELEVEVKTKKDLSVGREDLRSTLFQIVRELLFNVVKHAETNRAIVELGEQDGFLVIKTTDQGRGFDVKALESEHASGYGLFTIRDRVRLLGGTIEIMSSPGDGTRVTVKVPLAEWERVQTAGGV